MLLLIRHAQVNIEPTVDSTMWRLSENGRLQSQVLATHLLKRKPDIVLTSTESKAIATGKVMAEVWGVPCQTWPDLHEHERDDNHFVSSKAEWQAMVAEFLANPTTLVLGKETAVQSARRFETAVKAAQAHFPNQKLAIVSHGRILTAFLSQHNAIDAVKFWKNLTLPAGIVVDEFGVME